MSLKRRFAEMTKHLCTDQQPSIYLKSLLDAGSLEDYPFNMLGALDKTPQSPIHHPEGNVWNHTCLVVDEAAKVRDKSSHPTAFMWAALLHDIGKPGTTRKRRGKITSYDHDKTGRDLAIEFLRALTDDEVLIQQVARLVRYHMQPLFVQKDMPFADMEAMKRDIDVEEVALLSYCDRMGRLHSDAETERSHTKAFLNKCRIDRSKRGPVSKREPQSPRSF